MSALAMLSDHLGKPRRGIVPVRLDSVLCRAWIALRDRRRDRVVFTNRGRELGEEDVDVEPSVSFALRLDRAVQGDDAWTRDALDVGLVELDVEVEQNGRRCLRARRRGELTVDRAQATHNLLSTLGGEGRRFTRRESLEMSDDEKNFASVAAGERRDDETLVADSAHRGHEPFLLQAVQRATNRRSTQPHPSHDGAFRDPRSRRQLARDDERVQLVVHARDVVDRLRFAIAAGAVCGTLGRWPRLGAAGVGWRHEGNLRVRQSPSKRCRTAKRPTQYGIPDWSIASECLVLPLARLSRVRLPSTISLAPA